MNAARICVERDHVQTWRGHLTASATQDTHPVEMENVSVRIM